MTKAQYRASQSLLGNKMSKRDTEMHGHQPIQLGCTIKCLRNMKK